MLSIPHLPPRDDLWTSSPFRHPSSTAPPDPHQNAHQNAQYLQHQQHAQSHHNAHSNNPLHATALRLTPQVTHHTNALALLASDENLIEARKLNVRKFGAHWLRPPGVAKTFQARLDEEAERREQAEISRREANAAAEMLAAEEEAQRVGGMQGDGVAEEEGEEEERDLDDDIVEAEGSESSGDADDDDDDDDEDDDEDEEGDSNEGGDVDGNMSRFTNEEQSFLEGSMVGGDGFDERATRNFLEAEDAEMDGRAQDRRDLGTEMDMERNLDDEVLEAGSYEHTDTEEEDDSDESDEEIEVTVDDVLNSSFMSVPGNRRRSGVVARRSGARVSDVSARGENMDIDTPWDRRRAMEERRWS